MLNIPQLLLAAGASTRMGKPKQLLAWNEKTIIEHQVETLLATGQDVLVVLGANADTIRPIIKDYPVTIIFNENWKLGMGSSLAFGIQQTQSLKLDYVGALISLVDQPLISADHYLKMIASFQPEEKQVVASASATGWCGVPVLFDVSYFEELKLLQGEDGAKKIIKQNAEAVIQVNAGKLLADIDTPEVYQQLKDITRLS